MAFNIMWQAPEFEYREKGVSWYWVSIIIAACIIAFSVWQHNFLFGLFIIIAEILVITWGNREPATLDFQLSDEHIAIGSYKIHLMKEFETWSAEDVGNGMTEFFFNFKSKIKFPLKFFAPNDKVE